MSDLKTKYIIFVAPFGQLQAANQRAGDLAEYQEAGIATFSKENYAQTIAGPQQKYCIMGHYTTEAQYQGWLAMADDLGGYVVVTKEWVGAPVFWEALMTTDEALASIGMEKPEATL